MLLNTLVSLMIRIVSILLMRYYPRQYHLRISYWCLFDKPETSLSHTSLSLTIIVFHLFESLKITITLIIFSIYSVSVFFY